MNLRFLSLSSLGLLVVLISGCGLYDPVVPAGRLITPSGTTNYTPKRGGFAINFPTVPTEKTEIKTENNVDVETTTYESETAPVSYIVVVTQFPPNTDTSNSANFLDEAEKGMIESAQITIEKSEDIHLGETPGRELQASMLKGAVLSRVRLFITPTASYCVMAVALKDELEKNKPSIDQIIDTFRLTG